MIKIMIYEYMQQNVTKPMIVKIKHIWYIKILDMIYTYLLLQG